MAASTSCAGRGEAPAPHSCRCCPIVGPQSWTGAEEHAARLEAARAVHYRPRGAWLFRQGEPAEQLFALVEGAVLISRDDGCGEPVAVHLAVPGTTLGFRGLLDGGRHAVSAQCATRALICSFPAATAEAAMEASRTLEGVFFRHMADELAAAQDRMLRMATLGVRDRLVLLLGHLAEPFGRPVGDGDGLLVATPISRRDMGALAGMNPETVSRCIRALAEDGLAHFTRRHVLIPSQKRLLVELARLAGHMS